MYPGPYVSTKMFPSEGGGIDALDTKGKNEADCSSWITQKAGNTSTTQKILVEVHPHQSVDELFEHYKKWYPAHQRQLIHLGPAKGLTMYNGSMLAFDCQQPTKRTSNTGTLGVSVLVFLPDHPSGLDVDRAKLAKGAAELSADTARYVSSTVLKCSSPRLPDGVPSQEPPVER